MRIGICDDCEEDLTLLKDICNQNGHIDIRLYHSGEHHPDRHARFGQKHRGRSASQKVRLPLCGFRSADPDIRAAPPARHHPSRRH